MALTMGADEVQAPSQTSGFHRKGRSDAKSQGRGHVFLVDHQIFPDTC